jgi:hypothetical protein
MAKETPFAQPEVIEALPPFSAPVGDYVFLDAWHSGVWMARGFQAKLKL